MAAQLDAWRVGPGDVAICGGGRGADLLFAENKGIFPKSSRIEMDRLQNFLDYSNVLGISLKRRKPADLVFAL